MDRRPSPPPRRPSLNNRHQPQQDSMGRAFRTPYPAAEAYTLSAEVTPRTPVETRLGPFVPTGSIITKDFHCEIDDPVTPLPETPTYKRIKTGWHGLPSPQTSSCGNGDNEQRQAFLQDAGPVKESSGEGNVDGRASDSAPHSPTSPFPVAVHSPNSATTAPIGSELRRYATTSTDGEDAKLALELEALSRPRARRSGRIHQKAIIKEETTSTGASSNYAARQPPALQKQTQDVITTAEPTISPFDVAVRSDRQLPVPLSLDWQLQYPAGGSTHPAYPWPTADPRLIFHAHFVPLKNGLPDVSLVSALALPVGWRQASWCGLHPVVFDPYQQAFKLTPIGVLPLTCEEVHQGGLQDYVPGGKLHPETGLLPTLTYLSDGSDADVFNFEGVDWTLPWTAYEHAVPFRSVMSSRVDTTFPDPPGCILQTPTHYLEERDCPDGVFDVEDGWRWLFEHQEGSILNFTPTPGKSRKGSGVQRTGRRYKYPIASLMANTMMEKKEDNEKRYLLNQDAREFDAIKSVATPVHINIALLRDVEFTLIEFLSYFPWHYQWRKGGDRLLRSGMSASDIANYINMSRRLPGATICNNSTVDNHVFWDKLEDGTRIKATCPEHEVLNHTAEHWTYDAWEPTDYPLLALAHGLVELPSGPDAGPLTALVKWCRDKKRYRTMLSDVPTLLQEAGISPLIESGDHATPDQDVLARHIGAIKKDRLRVLRERRQLDVAKDKKPTKRRFE